MSVEKRHLEIDGVAENHCVHTANVEATPFRFTRNNIEGKFYRKMSFHEFWIKILREREAISLYPRSTRNPRVAERERKRERDHLLRNPRGSALFHAVQSSRAKNQPAIETSPS